MHNKKFPSVMAIFAAAIAVFSAAKFARAETASHLIINEIQTAGASSNDEFVELFNPSESSIVLDGYRLSKKTKSGSESTLLSSATSTKFLGIIPAHGYFLIAHPDYKGSYPADLAYSSSSSISSDNTLILYDKSGTLLDKVGFGATIDFEGSPAPNPSSNQSIERNSFVDTNNNIADIFTNNTPSPRNSAIFESDGEAKVPNDDVVDESAEEADDNATDDSTKCTTSSTNIKLNEIFPYPQSGDEFVEIANTGDSCVDVSGWKVMDDAGHKKSFPENSVIEPGEYLYLEGNLYQNNDSDTAYLLDLNGVAKNDALDQVSYEKAKENYSYALSDESFSWTSTPTPGEENFFASPAIEGSIEASAEASINSDDRTDTPEKVYLNEILPNPKDGSDNEYVEIASGDAKSVDLFGWRIKDASKSKGYQFKEHFLLNPGEYLAVYRPNSKISLNNAAESVYLYNPQNEVSASVSFDKSQKNSSYNFDGKTWKWSKYLTPGKENKFDSKPSVKITKPKNAYKNIFTEFFAKAKDKETKKLKYAWDFGDGKKSYLATTTHKYLATGKYTVTLSVSDESQTVENNFSIKVKKYPQPNIELVKLIPNPTGNDSESETIDVQNNSGRQINLAGWKIATGSGDKIFNHPISGEISVDPGGTKTITREFSKFSLNNKAGKVQLVIPDGKVIDEIEYSKDPPDSLRDSKRAGKIAEDEAYAKMDGEWMWIESGAPDENADEAGTVDEESDSEEVSGKDTINDGEVLGATDENKLTLSNYNPAFSSEDAFIFLSDIGFLRLQNKEINYCPLKNATASLEYFLISSI
jgi:hypothetical protein